MHVNLVKKQIANRFSRATHSYDRAATVQRQVGDRLLGQLVAYHDNVAVILDLGGGTGFYTQSLINLFPEQQIIYLDMAAAMAQRACYDDDVGRAIFIQADFDHIPLHENSVSQIFANMTLQWSLNLTMTLTELKQVMAPGASLHFSLPITGTLSELAKSSHAGSSNCVNQFLSLAELIDCTASAGFDLKIHANQRLIYYYPTVTSIITQLRAIGANSMIQATPRRYGGKQFMRQLAMNYEMFRCSQGLPVTYQIVYGECYVNQ
jgi:malonyl-CoA O-methyltransferase